MKRLPRSNGTDPVVIDAAVWDRIADAVERAANLSVAPPLHMEETMAGPVIGFTHENFPRVPIKIASVLTAVGMYTVKVGTWKDHITEGSSVTLASLFDFPTTANGAAIDINGIAGNGHRFGIDQIMFASPLPSSTDQYNLLYEIICDSTVPVICVQTGGVAGDSTTMCSFTYTIKSLDGTTIATSVAVLDNGNRTAIGAYAAGGHGTAVNIAGTWYLLYVSEKPAANLCT